MKTKLILIAAVMLLAFTVGAYAQTGATYTVSQETIDKVACCGLAEPTGAIAFNAVASSPASVTGTITLRYNLPIANTGGGATGVQITTAGAGGLTPATLTASNDAITGQGVVVITVPAGNVYPNTMTLSNVRINVSGSCNTSTGAVEAHASSTGNFLTIGETDAIALVKSVGPALVAPTVPTPISVNASNGVITGSGTTAVTFSEAFLTAFGHTSTFPDTTRTYQTLIRLTVSAIPTGVTITFPNAQGIFQVSSSTGVPSASNAVLTASTGVQYVYYVMTAASSPAATDTLPLLPTAATAGPFPLAPANVTISAALAPITTGATATAFPSYTANCETSPVTFLTVSGVLNTILLVPYATTEVGYNTALSVANTTKDPGTTAMANFPTAIQQTGKITIYFYPKNGSTIASWVSTSYPSLYGLDSAGKLPAGGTFVALLSQILPTTVTEFGGYLFIVTDFTNAHVEFFVSNFDNFTHGALMLVVSDLDRATSGAGRTQEQGLSQ